MRNSQRAKRLLKKGQGKKPTAKRLYKSQPKERRTRKSWFTGAVTFPDAMLAQMKKYFKKYRLSKLSCFANISSNSLSMTTVKKIAKIASEVSMNPVQCSSYYDPNYAPVIKAGIRVMVKNWDGASQV